MSNRNNDIIYDSIKDGSAYQAAIKKIGLYSDKIVEEFKKTKNLDGIKATRNLLETMMEITELLNLMK